MLVARAFIGKAPTKRYQVNHKDLNKQNNCDWNLEWVTNKENSDHYFANGFDTAAARRLSLAHRGDGKGNTKLTCKQVELIRKLYTGVPKQQCELAVRFGVTRANIRSIVNRKTWGWFE